MNATTRSPLTTLWHWLVCMAFFVFVVVPLASKAADAATEWLVDYAAQKDRQHLCDLSPSCAKNASATSIPYDELNTLPNG